MTTSLTIVAETASLTNIGVDIDACQHEGMLERNRHFRDIISQITPELIATHCAETLRKDPDADCVRIVRPCSRGMLMSNWQAFHAVKAALLENDWVHDVRLEFGLSEEHLFIDLNTPAARLAREKEEQRQKLVASLHKNPFERGMDTIREVVGRAISSMARLVPARTAVPALPAPKVALPENFADSLRQSATQVIQKTALVTAFSGDTVRFAKAAEKIAAIHSQNPDLCRPDVRVASSRVACLAETFLEYARVGAAVGQEDLATVADVSALSAAFDETVTMLEGTSGKLAGRLGNNATIGAEVLTDTLRLSNNLGAVRMPFVIEGRKAMLVPR